MDITGVELNWTMFRDKREKSLVSLNYLPSTGRNLIRYTATKGIKKKRPLYSRSVFATRVTSKCASDFAMRQLLRDGEKYWQKFRNTEK